MTPVEIGYVRGAEDPPLQREWLDYQDNPVDLSVYGTITLRMQAGDADPILKDTGVTGDAQGIVTIMWAVGDLDIPVDLYRCQVWARDGADRDRVMPDLMIRIVAAIPLPSP